jgi:hypothetical protein
VNETLDLKLLAIIPLESTKPEKVSVRSLTDLSPDTIKRNFSKYVVQLTPKREGMAMGDALKIAAGKAS